MAQPVVSIIMGSDSDLPVMQPAADVLKQFGVEYELMVMSAHRTPENTFEFAKAAAGRGIQVIISGAGGAAHLAGVVASSTTLPVIGVPINSSNSVSGIDSLLSTVQMPSGIPVATVAINGGKNAGILAAQIIALHQPDLQQKLINFKQSLKDGVQAANDRLNH
ncbi:MAG: hypothetical protein ACD_41C00387G0003 [uncultured bacterium]|nr:MAG: hypothetical protein ACD_41C00387G0003 [uncultured bacterium]HBY73409.1 5-(carboxyamino)imidazole ribonucleotide mutase [Candidatus Kerfeldbacteria bacterium]